MPYVEGFCSVCEIINNNLVLKRYKPDFISIGLLDNEVKWYQKFINNSNLSIHTPKLLDCSGDTLVLEYVGTPITEDLIPVNFKDQLREIACFLENHRCLHCDITPSNLLVFNSNIYIIDFGWAVEVGQNPYLKWEHANKAFLDGMGSSFRAPNWPDDKYSLDKIYKELACNQNSNLFL